MGFSHFMQQRPTAYTRNYEGLVGLARGDRASRMRIAIRPLRAAARRGRAAARAFGRVHNTAGRTG